MKLCVVGQTGNRINRIITEVLSVVDDYDGWKKCIGFFCHHQGYTQKTVTVYALNA